MRAPTLTEGPVTLRPHVPGDVEAVLEQGADAGSQRWTTVPAPYTRLEAEKWVASRPAAWASDLGERTFVVESQGRYAGQVGLRPDGAGGAEIGFGLSPWARGRGLMSRAVRLALTWGFSEGGLEVVHWRAHVGNWASRRVAWACGFVVEGQVRCLEAQRGERKDAWIGSILPGEDMTPRTRWLDVPRLRGRAVELRRHVDDDAVRIVEGCSDPLTQQWLPSLPSPYTIMDAATYLTSREEQHASGSGVYWAMADPGDDRLLGAIGVFGLEGRGRGGEIGYWVHPDARARGVGTEATLLAARRALLPEDDGGLGLTRVMLRVADGNRASCRLAQRSGFTLVGRDRRAEQLRDGSTPDFLRFDLLTDEVATP